MLLKRLLTIPFGLCSLHTSYVSNHMGGILPLRSVSGNADWSIHALSENKQAPFDGEELPERDILYRKLFITVKGHEPEVLRSYETFVREVCDNLELNLLCETRNRPTFTRLSLNKSPFIYKKHQRQYEFRTHYKYFTINRITGCTADVFLEYIQRNLPEGVAMIVTRHRLEKLPEPLRTDEKHT